MRSRLARTLPGYQHSLGRVLAVYLGVMFAMFLAALDQTIIATALPHIVSDLGGVASYSWAITGYLLAATVAAPLAGKLADVHGRRTVFLAAIGIFVVGSALCGTAQDMTQLVVFRGLQGLGAGGIFPLALATVGGIVPPRERGRYQGLVGATFAAASIAGPALGGFLVDQASWRWIFYVNLPVGAVAFVLVALTQPREARRAGRSVDYPGAVVLAGGTAALLLGLVWGGRDYAWGSAEVIGAFAAAAVLLVVFALVERRARETILPFVLLRARPVAVGLAATLLGGMALLGTIAFVPLFVQGVLGKSASASGVVVTPFLIAAAGASVLSGAWVSRSGRYKANALLGFAVLAAALFLFSRMSLGTTTGRAALYAVLAGVGLGLVIQVLVLVVQNAVPAGQMGSATALIQFARTIGGTIGVAVLSAIVSAGLPPGRVPRAAEPQALPPLFRAELADAMRPAFLVAAGVCVAAFLLLVFGLEERPLRRRLEVEGGLEPTG